jgi:hypothetical protein
MSSDEERQKDRRAFMKGTVGTTLAGAAAVLGAAKSASAQIPTLEAVKLKAVDGVIPRAAKSQVAITFDRETVGRLNLNDLQVELQRVFDKFGCPNCGLVGFDMLVAVNPVSHVSVPNMNGSIIVSGQ